MSFRDTLGQRAISIGSALDGVLNAYPEDRITDAMRYAVAGGKRLRGFLVLESAHLHDIPETEAMWPAMAIEAMHAYSLVHDDLPCMDDDDLRRGQPTVHIKWDEATAVLAGDALQTLAFDLVGRGTAPADRRLELSRRLALASGGEGMVQGQSMDIAAEEAGSPLSLTEIETLQSLKTGALIEWSAIAGPVLAGADTGVLETYSKAIGLAFQIADDILDVEGDEAKAGKRLRKDDDAGKATFVSLLGLDEAKARAQSLVTEACDALAGYGPKAETLMATARFIVDRDS